MAVAIVAPHTLKNVEQLLPISTCASCILERGIKKEAGNGDVPSSTVTIPYYIISCCMTELRAGTHTTLQVYLRRRLGARARLLGGRLTEAVGPGKETRLSVGQFRAKARVKRTYCELKLNACCTLYYKKKILCPKITHNWWLGWSESESVRYIYLESLKVRPTPKPGHPSLATVLRQRRSLPFA